MPATFGMTQKVVAHIVASPQSALQTCKHAVVSGKQWIASLQLMGQPCAGGPAERQLLFATTSMTIRFIALMQAVSS